jgi:Transglutaminase-like superfamily
MLRRPWHIARRAPVAGETVLVYARARRRMAHEHDVRELLSAARRALSKRPQATSLPEARHLARTVSLTLTLLPNDARCLVRSIVLIELLARRGLAATLVIGTNSAPDFSAHAWVELDGEPLLSPAGFGEGRLAEL